MNTNNFKPTPETQKIVDEYNDVIYAKSQETFDKLKKAGMEEDFAPFVLQLQLLSHLTDMFAAMPPAIHKASVTSLMAMFQRRFNEIADEAGTGCGDPNCKNCQQNGERIKLEVEQIFGQEDDGTLH